MAVACGHSGAGQCEVPALAAGQTYTQAAAGGHHTVLLRSDGSAVACGSEGEGQCDLPELVGGLTYTKVAAGGDHTVLLRSDGSAVVCGYNPFGQCDLPALPDGLTYTQVAAGWAHTVLIRSDGAAVACGRNNWGQCDLPVLAEGFRYEASLMPQLFLQGTLVGDSMCFVTFGGVERCRIRVAPTSRLADVRARLTADHRSGSFGSGFARVDAVLPGRMLLSRASSEDTVADAFAGAPGTL
ncbi:unnamed protein product [Prorocentrum cordatum]|uniref:Uncharacterized protein n=1 Tax=Prorocentrum cordatum TaxID=2364126 RepID=A0ABN9PIG2_9DINO|nr:unnamed protein product [Polarella glacialis]